MLVTQLGKSLVPRQHMSLTRDLALFLRTMYGSPALSGIFFGVQSSSSLQNTSDPMVGLVRQPSFKLVPQVC